MEIVMAAFDSISATAWTAFGTALIALSGVWLTNWNNRKSLKIQLEHDEKLQRQKVFRERLEDLYGLIGQLDNHVSTEVLDVALLVDGLMTDEEYLKRHSPTEIAISADQIRLEMIVGIYGKKFKSTYETVNNARDAVIALRAELERLYLEDLPTEEIDQSMNEAHKEFQEAVKALKAEIAESVLA